MISKKFAIMLQDETRNEKENQIIILFYKRFIIGSFKSTLNKQFNDKKLFSCLLKIPAILRRCNESEIFDSSGIFD